MHKHIVGLLLLFFFVFTVSSCQTSKNPNNSNASEITQSDTITLDYLKRNSDACVIITTCVPEYYNIKTINDQIYTTVDFIPMGWQDKYYQKCKTFTIIENTKSYIEPESVYVVFLSKSEDNDGYYLSCGKSSIFSVKSGDIKPLDYKMKNEVKTHWNNDINTFEVWFNENYKDPALTTEPMNTEVITTIQDNLRQ
ncbi:MAG: hypothetical protein E7522_06280 [Ruminococcaceae bacterium]|nr:hypothetical protein [Oscillospiraceae bacterium]